MTDLLEQPGASTAAPTAQEVYTFPLSSAQQGLWLLSQLQLQNPAYHIPTAWVLRGPLRPEVLERALDEIVARHEVLRTTFAVLDGEPAQVVAPPRPAGLERVDLSHLPAAERDAAAERLTAEEARRPFDPARGPLFRATLARLGEAHHLLVCTAHHLVFDGWSEGVMLRELTALYRAFAAGDESTLPELEVQYGDYAHWEREWLQCDDAAARLAYWREQLLDAPDVTPLPADRRRPDEPSHAGGYHSFEVGTAVAARLAAAARAEGATQTAAVLAAFAVLLHGMAGGERVLLGSPVANRGQVELEGVIGFFVDALVLGVDVSGDPPFRELVRRAAATLYAAHEHALPFAHLVQALKPRRDPGRNPYFQVLFNFDTASPQGTAELAPGIAITPYAVATGSPQFDLVLSLQDTGAGMRGTLAYAADLFDPATAARLVRGLETVLARAAEDPARRASELLLDDAARRRVVTAWNDTARAWGDGDGGRTLHGLVAAQARRTPGAVAVEGEDEALTFAELDARSGRLARRLRAAGVGAESVVAIHLDRSPEMVVAALAALRAGGAYLPVDPDYPADRRLLMLEDSGARALVTTRAHLASLPLPAGVRAVCVDDAAEAEAHAPGAADEGAGDPGRLAYVIYTSGSTGRPKGAMNEHGAVVNRLRWMQEAYGLGAGDAVLQKTPFSFDVSVWELFWPLLTGARLVLARPEGHRDPEYLRDRICARGVTTLHFVPSMLRAFLEVEGVERCAATLRRVVCSGEALAPDLQERFFARLPGVELHNLYGPTECAVDVTAHACARDPGARTVPIGRPVANTAAYVLDARGNPVPPGFPGELCIGGVQVGRGYLGRPALTAERFVPDPCSGVPGARLYRTGDLACWREGEGGGAALEYLGRIDHQVKVRGFRIELGEIEAALREHPGVRAAAVAAREGAEGGGARLVAYVAAAAEPAPSAAELRSHLAARLPEHMLPAAFVALEALPLTPSGKLDRRALPDPGAERAGVDEAYAAPRNVVEDTLAALWAGVLGLDRVGVHDNFFALGGDSILGLRITALARERGLPATIRLLFRNPTVARLAEAMEAERVGDEELHTAPFSLVSPEDRARLPEEAVDAYPLSRMQLGMLFHQESSDAPLYHGLTSFHVQLPLDEEKLDRAMRAVMERHPNLRTGFDLESYSEPLQVVYARAESPVFVHDLRGLSEAAQREALARFCREEQDRRFDLPVPPQIRFHLHRRTDETVQFTLVENHAVSDGWSLHTVIADVLACYFALLRGEALPELPPLRTAFRDFIHLERRALASEETRAFWRARVEGFEPALLAPAAPAEARDGPRVLKVDRRLRRSLLEALRAVARREAVPLKSVLLAAHLRVLAHFTGSRDLATGLSSNGRPETVDGDRVAGLFLNTLPLRADLSGGTWRELIRRVHEGELALMPHRRYPLSAIQAEAGGRALFDASFVYLNFHVVGEHVRSGPMRVLGTSAVLEETDFTLMTSFQHLPGNDRVLGVSVEGDRRALGDARIREIAACYLRVLRALAADPDARYDAVPLLDAAEREALLRQAAGPGVALPERPVHHAFAEHAARTPGHPCVEGAEGALSYGEVHRLSGRLAARLRDLGAGPGARVALCMDRVPEIVPAVLAAFRAGAAYVPLDPGHPRERLHALLRDAGAAAVVTLERWRDRVEGAGVPVLGVEDDGGPALEGADACDPASLAYVIYTSGTTGRPKGVAVEHRQLAHYAAAAAGQLALPEGGRYALASTFAADLGNTVLFPALRAGGTLRVLSEAEATDPVALAAALEGRPVDVLKIVPSHLRALLTADRPEAVLPRRALVLGGEAADWALVERVRALVPGVRVFNHYGPTETTVGVLAGELDPAAPGRPAAPPLGRPLGRARVYLLDAHLLPVPAGTAGELYVGGDAVARGYIGAPAPTAERFLPDPFAAGARMYRTGDRGRLLADGRIEFLGRADDQVKVRGFRVEPGEAEAALRAHPAVAACAVVARRDEGETLLAAYVVAREGAALPDEAELRAFAGRTLPAHAVPARVVRLAELPLTANGKLDRRALPAPGQAAAETAAAEPRTPVEETVRGIWKAVLKVETVGIHDPFFALGGDSIRAILVSARVRKAFGITFSVEDLFAAETVAGVAETVERALQAQGSPAAPITPAARTGDLPLSFGQQRFWYEHLLDPSTSAHNVPTALRLVGPLDVPALEAALGEIGRRHEVLRTRFPMVDGVPRQVIDAPGGLVLRRLDLLTTVAPDAREEALVAAAREEAWAPFDLEHGPVVRALLIRAEVEEHLLVITTHHAVTDGWSVGLVLRELDALYAAFHAGEASALPELAVQYADYAVWQRERVKDEVLEAQAAYWRRQLAGAAPLELRTDHPRPAARSSRGGVAWHTLSPELSEGLKEASRREGVTVFMALLAGFAVLLHHHSDAEDLVVGSPVATHRDREELQGVVGCFLNMLALRVDLAGDPSLRELLQRVRRMALEAYANQELPFEKLVDALGTRRGAGRTPVFQVLFNHSLPGERIRMDGLKLGAGVNLGDPTSEFDLELATEDLGDRLGALLRYRSDLFEPETATALLAELEAVLGRMVAAPDQPLSALRLALEDDARARRERARGERDQALRGTLRGAKRKAITIGT